MLPVTSGRCPFTTRICSLRSTECCLGRQVPNHGCTITDLPCQLHMSSPWQLATAVTKLNTRTHTQTQISWNLVCPQHIFHLLNRFDILHRARQYHCRSLCNISKRLGNWKICPGQTWFHEIWVDVCMLRQPPDSQHTVPRSRIGDTNRHSAPVSYVRYISGMVVTITADDDWCPTATTNHSIGICKYHCEQKWVSYWVV